MEIERKFLVKYLPDGLEDNVKKEVSQGYISVDPVIRIRRSNDRYFLTVKTSGLLAREEFETDITAESFDNLRGKCDGNIISKTRYKIPCGDYVAELDIFHEIFEGLRYVEVEFPSLEEAEAFTPPDYFGRELTGDARYQNSSLSKMKKEDISSFLESVKAL